MFEGYDALKSCKAQNEVDDITRLQKIWMLELERISNNIAFLGRIPNNLGRR